MASQHPQPAAKRQSRVQQSDKDGMPTIGRRVRAVRLRANLTLAEFAGALGYSKRAVVNWEQNTAAVPISVLDKLRQLYDVDPEWVVSGTNLIPTRHYGGIDWERLDRIIACVRSACADASLTFTSDQRDALSRLLFENGEDGTHATRARLFEIIPAVGFLRAMTLTVQPKQALVNG